MQEEALKDAHCQYVNDYKLHFLLGQGGQASVYLGSKGNQLCALKIYSPSLSKEEAFKRQVQFLENLKHPYLINIVDADQNAQVKLKNSKPEKRSMIALQYAEGEMFDFISKEGRFSPQICRTLFKQMIDAIKFLDEKGITHRDLKPENILFDRQFNLKISDFGLSTFTEGHYKNGILYSKVGTQGYKSPEMEKGEYTGLQADLFAAGVILFIMYNGTPPFMCTKPTDKIYKLIKDQSFAKFWSLHEKKKPLGFYPDSFKRLVNEFLSFDPLKRPTLVSLSQDQWLNSVSADSAQLKEYMQKRYDKIAEEDEVKRKVAQVRKQMFMHEIMQEQNIEDNQNLRARGVQVSSFIENTKQFGNIKIDSLPQSQANITYLSKDVGFILAFLKDYISECETNSTVFLQDFLQQILPSKFEMKLVNHNEVDLKFVFDIDEQSEEVLKIKGKLYQNGEGKIGIEWIKVQGNDFWLSSIVKELNQRLKVLV